MRPQEGSPSASVCVVGAGASGLVALQVLAERGLRADGYELGSDVGGLWRYGNDNGRAVAYASLRANTSRDRTGYRRFPLSPELPAYPGHADVLRWLEGFADRYALRERIVFRTEVTGVAPAGTAASGAVSPAGGWEVTVRDVAGGEERTCRYDAVIVASGHHWRPSVPPIPGEFDGLLLHSSGYRTPEAMVGKRVLVVGIGNSGCDIVCEAAGVARRTLLSTRRGAHVLPKWVLGRPLDHWMTPLTSRLPLALQRAVLGALVRLERGSQCGSGVPVPPYPIGAEHPTISQELLELARSGRVEAVPEIVGAEGRRVRFAGGREEEVDVLILATGYEVSFPFLSPRLVRVTENRVPLYLHVVPPEWRGLFFLGLVQPLGAIPPLAEAQAEWVADLLEGRAALPDAEAMWEEVRSTERRMAERFVASRRHTMEVDFWPYLRALERERRQGRRRKEGRREG